MEEILSSIKRVIEESEAAPAAPRRPRAAARTVASEDRDEVLELSERAPLPELTPEPRPIAPEPPMSSATASKPAAPAEPILSSDAAQASRGSLEALSRLVVKPEVTGSDTLEGMVREMLRPMLREWLDANLPQIVETMVSREIARISGRSL
jgi:cell pole-organizing protein PopZ